MDTPYRSDELESAAAGFKDEADTVAENAVGAVDSGRRAAAGGFQSTARALRSTADKLPGTSRAREVVDGAADVFDGTARYLRDRQVTDMVEDVRSRAKASPMAFVLGALAVGFLAGRMLRRT